MQIYLRDSKRYFFHFSYKKRKFLFFSLSTRTNNIFLCSMKIINQFMTPVIKYNNLTNMKGPFWVKPLMIFKFMYIFEINIFDFHFGHIL